MNKTSNHKERRRPSWPVVAAALSALLGGLGACAGEDAGDELASGTGEGDEELAPPQPEGAASAVEIASFARAAGISPAEAAARLARQARVPDLGLVAAHRLGSAFGGVWIDTQAGDRIKVGVVTSGPATPGLAAGAPDWDSSREALDLDEADSSPATKQLAARLRAPAPLELKTRPQLLSAVAGAIQEIGLADAADVVEVERSLAELESANEWLADRIEALGPDSGLVAGIRTDLNAVEIQTPAGATPSAEVRALIDEAASLFGDGLVASEYEGRAEPRACRYPYCDPPLRGGNKIFNTGRVCTNAFVARGRSTGNYYQFTAGHCVVAPFTDDWSTRFPNNTVHIIGPRHDALWGAGGDMAILRVSNPTGWHPENWVNVTAGPDTTASPEYTISSERGSSVGMRICTTGGNFGRTDCGVVTRLGVTASYGGRTVRGLGRGSFCGVGGDSGAPMYAGHVAYGLQVAGFSICDSLYQGILSAEVQMNVNVQH